MQIFTGRASSLAKMSNHEKRRKGEEDKKKKWKEKLTEQLENTIDQHFVRSP